MSDEDIYRQIGELEKQIGELRGKLPSAPDWKAPKLREGESLEKQEKGQPFRIHSEVELELKGLPDLVRQILDALQVQVYVKKAKIDDKRDARKYTYLNQAVREINKWSREEALAKYDCDVFADGDAAASLFDEAASLFLDMRNRETETIRSKESKISFTPWTLLGGGWSRNQNFEIPILNPDSDCIGLCSLSQNIVFEEVSRILAIYQQDVRHSVRNLNTAVTGLFIQATIALEAFRRDHPKEQMLDAISGLFQSISHELNHYTSSSYFQIAALDSMTGTLDSGRICEIIDDLKGRYTNCGFTLSFCSLCTADLDTRVLQPEIVKAILSVLIANAVGKHQPNPGNGILKRCDVDCKVANGEIEWTVSNPCKADAKSYTVPDELPHTMHDALIEGFDKRLLTYFVIRGFPNRKPSITVRTQKLDAPDRFNAMLTIEAADYVGK